MRKIVPLSEVITVYIQSRRELGDGGTVELVDTVDGEPYLLFEYGDVAAEEQDSLSHSCTATGQPVN